MRVPNTIAACIMLLLSLQLQGCGHKGPLTMPQERPATQQPNQGQ